MILCIICGMQPVLRMKEVIVKNKDISMELWKEVLYDNKSSAK